MELEQEVKILDIDFCDFEKKLLDKGAVLLDEEDQSNILIESSFLSIIPLGSYLRIRKSKSILNNTEKNYLTYKKKIENGLLRENREYTTEISDINSLLEILSNMGYDKFIYSYKHRKSYIYKECRIDFDEWDKKTYPKPYVEIEVKKYKDLDELIKEFDIAKENICLKPIRELQLEVFGDKND